MIVKGVQMAYSKEEQLRGAGGQAARRAARKGKRTQKQIDAQRDAARASSADVRASAENASTRVVSDAEHTRERE